MTKIYFGKITGFHGLKGDLKIVTDFDKKSIVFTKGFNLYIDGNVFLISTYKLHKKSNLVTLNDLYDLNLVKDLIGKSVYIEKDDLNLRDDEYILSELIDFLVYDDKDVIGTVKDIRLGSNVNYLYVSGDKNFYIPMIDEYIVKVDVSKKEVITKGGKELIV